MARQQSPRNHAKERRWRSLLQQWRRSGLTVRAFCAQHGLSEPSFYYWQRTIARRDHQTSGSPPPARPPHPSPTTRTRSAARRPESPLPLFVPLGVTAGPLTASAGRGTLEVVLGLGRVVRVPPGFDAATLRQLLAVLEAPSC